MAKLYSVYNGDDFTYYVYTDGAYRDAQRRANDTGEPVEVTAHYIHHRLTIHDLVACLNGSKWCGTQETLRTIQPMTGIKLRNFYKNEAELAEYRKWRDEQDKEEAAANVETQPEDDD